MPKIKSNLILTALLLTSFCLVLTSCSSENKSAKFESAKDVKADEQVTKSFTTHPTPAVPENLSNQTSLDLNTDKTRISISKNALEKEFLLQASMIPQTGVALSSGLKSRVVAFRKKDNKLFLMESTQGHTVSTDLPQNLILTEFPILSESTDGHITFDFAAGMSSLFVFGDWHASDFEPNYDPGANFQSVPVRHSFIESAEINKKNQLVIRQISQLSLYFLGMVESNTPVEVKYYLSPYRPNPNFKPFVSSKNFDRMGFFEVAPQARNNKTDIVYASKFDMSKPIVFAISENTPAEFKQAVKDGVLYWNKAFGKEVVTVVDAPAGVTAPNADYNVVQWVSWDNAGFAYADGQMDPRTGETLNAQVFFTSAFSFGGRESAKRLLRKLRLNEGTAKPKEKQLTLRGFAKTPMCDYEMGQQLANSIEKLLATDASDAAFLKAAQDYVREVSAHEIGHTLGLRHNFAGSLAANYAAHERNNLAQKYFNEGSAPAGIVTSSSVMEYQQFIESIITGDQIAKSPTALEYDKKAIEALYLSKKFTDSEIPVFCTDSHADRPELSDCIRFDYGPSFVESAAVSIKELSANVPYTIFEAYVASQTPDAGEESTPLNKVKLPSADSLAQRILMDQANLVRNMTVKGGLLKTRRSFPIVDSLNIEEVRNAELSYIQSEIQKLGGMNKVMSPISETYVNDSMTALDKIIQKYRDGIGNNNQKYSFSDADIVYIKTQAQKLFQQTETKITKLNLEILAGKRLMPGSKIVDHQLGDDFADFLRIMNDKYVMSYQDILESEVDLTNATSSTPNKKTVKLPKFSYPQDVRVVAASLLKCGRGQSPSWGIFHRGETREKFKKLTEDALTTSLTSVAPEKQKRPVSNWIYENRQVSSELNEFSCTVL
jgi:hypothetical protein